MLISRILSSGGLLKNGVACSVGRRIIALQTHSYYSSTDSNKSSTEISAKRPLALILQVYKDAKGKLELTQFGQELDKLNNGKIKLRLDQLAPEYNVGDVFVVTDLVSKDKTAYQTVALSCCGPKDAKVDKNEGIDEKKENIRCCFGKGYRVLDSTLLYHSLFDQMHFEPHLDKTVTPYANEGYILGRYKVGKEFGVQYCDNNVQYAWAHGQCWARHLSEKPMNPESVVKEVKKQLCPLKVEVRDYNKKQIEDTKMSAFLAVAQGSSAEPRLLECHYHHDAHAPLVLVVAKGVTFDSGGLSLKPEDLLKREGMTGAAAALGAVFTLATLQAPVNVKVVVPLCENMISGQCLKVGDVVPTLQGLDVKVEDTGLEGHLLLADALTYGQKIIPKVGYIMSVAALTPDIATATGGVCYGCYTPNDKLWDVARDAGIETGDRPWRFPIWKSYANLITERPKSAIDTPYCNLKNRGPGMASHCTGAAFLSKFVTGDNWLHYDITGVGKMTPEMAPSYLDPNFMTGRPTRALVSAILKISGKKQPDDDTCNLM